MNNFGKSIALGAALVLSSGVVAAQKDNVGKLEYDSNCATCHGVTGKGDGPLAGYLTQKPSDLTTLSMRNNGVFPVSLLQALIDGREVTAVHGTRDMPAWGNEYDQRAVEYYSDYFSNFSAESFIRTRILALVDYIHGLQAK
jgi:mono/diheme cytochrome c family protein